MGYVQGEDAEEEWDVIRRSHRRGYGMAQEKTAEGIWYVHGEDVKDSASTKMRMIS